CRIRTCSMCLRRICVKKRNCRRVRNPHSAWPLRPLRLCGLPVYFTAEAQRSQRATQRILRRCYCDYILAVYFSDTRLFITVVVLAFESNSAQSTQSESTGSVGVARCA